jgi:hypothetical protein
MGVAHPFACPANSISPLRSPERLKQPALPKPAVGVCQSFAHVCKLGVPALGRVLFDPFCELPDTLAAGVGYCERE